MGWLTDLLLYVLLYIPWLVFIQGPLVLINVVLKKDGIFDYLTTDVLTNLIFGNFTKDPFDTKSLPVYFLALAILATGLIVIMFIMQLIIIQFTETHTIREKLGKAIKNTFLAIIVIIFIPLFMSIINYLMTGLLEVLKITSLGQENSLADLLWGIGASSQAAGGHQPGDYTMPPIDALKNWNFILEFIAVWFTLYVLFVAAMTLVERIIDLLLLFSISPIVAAMMPVDQGKRLGVWKEMVVGKFIIGPGTMLPIYIFLEILPKAILDISSRPSFTWVEKQVLYTLFCTAGAISCLKTQKIINHLVTQNLGVQSAIDSNGAGIASSIAGKAAGFAALASGGVSALKLGKQVAFGGAKDGTNPDGSKNEANGLLKNGLTGYLGKGAKGISKGFGKAGKNIADEGGGFSGFGKTAAKGTGNFLASPFTGLYKVAKNAYNSGTEAIGNSYRAGRNPNPDPE